MALSHKNCLRIFLKMLLKGQVFILRYGGRERVKRKKLFMFFLKEQQLLNLIFTFIRLLELVVVEGKPHHKYIRLKKS